MNGLVFGARKVSVPDATVFVVGSQNKIKSEGLTVVAASLSFLGLLASINLRFFTVVCSVCKTRLSLSRLQYYLYFVFTKPTEVTPLNSRLSFIVGMVQVVRIGLIQVCVCVCLCVCVCVRERERERE